MAMGRCLRPNYCQKLLNLSRPYAQRHSIIKSIIQQRMITQNAKLESWLTTYEDIVGLRQVREAQDKVVQAENKFKRVQQERRNKQNELTVVQSNLRALSAELEKVTRGDERYLELLTKEHGIIKQERSIQDTLELVQDEEHETFEALSASVRESHEKERARSERTKYWGIIGSIIGAIIGITGTSINNYLRMREMRAIVTDSASQGSDMKGLIESMTTMMSNQYQQTRNFVDEIKLLMGQRSSDTEMAVISNLNSIGPSQGQMTSKEFEDHLKVMMDKISLEDIQIRNEMKDIRDILESYKTITLDDGTTYIGPDVKNIIKETEENLEWKIKSNALWTVTAIYGAFALGGPLIYHLLKS